MRIVVDVETDGADFENETIAGVWQIAADSIFHYLDRGYTDGRITDRNGNTVGTWTLTR